MIHPEMDDTEKEDLREFLQHYLNFLKVEVHHTDTRTFREGLKRREKVVENLLEQLGSNENH